MNWLDDLFVWTWNLTVALAISSVVILVVLTVRRALSSRRDRNRAKRWEELTGFIHAALQSPVKIDPSALPQLKPGDHDIILHIALEMIRSITGGDVDEIVQLIARFDLLAFLKSELRGRKRSSRLKALTLLGYFPASESRDLLFEQVQETDPFVQMAALRGLARHAESIDSSDILRELKNSFQNNALMLADILRRFGADYLPALHDLAAAKPQDGRTAARKTPSSPQTNERVRVAAVIAIGNIGDLASVETLSNLLADHNDRIRAAAAQALGRIGDSSAASRVAALLQDNVEDVRIQSARALGRLQAESTLPGLVACLKDRSWSVRFRAAESLVRFGDSGIALLRATGSRTGPDGEIATQVLAEMVPV